MGMIVLGIESSCDETAAAVVDDSRRILAERLFSQLDAHRPYGGVVPEVAARAHLEHLGPLIAETLREAGIGFADLDGIAATAGPGLIGGVIVGVTMGKAIAAVHGKPFLAVNHLEGHALSARLSDDVPFPYLLLLVSGGHCQLLEVRGIGDMSRLGTTIDDAAGAKAWGIASQAQIELVPPLGGFVGSDLIAGLLACRLNEGSAPALFIDFGTNSEIALWTGSDLWVTATAGGPAFESGAGSCGTPAEAGAVFRVAETADGGLAFRVLDDDCAHGLCGSGLVDLVACLRRRQRLDAKGRFAEGAKNFAFAVGEREFSLGLRDIDALQRAKAAVGAGIAALSAVAGLPLAALQRVVVAGLFGRYQYIANAQAIGLLPSVPVSHIELVGNTAAAGATALLLSTQAQAMANRLRQQAQLINLAHRPEFEDAFLEHLYLRPTEAS